MIRAYESGDFKNLDFMEADLGLMRKYESSPEHLEILVNHSELYTLEKDGQIHAVFGMMDTQPFSEVFVFRGKGYKDSFITLAKSCKRLLQTCEDREIFCKTDASEDMLKWAKFLGFRGATEYEGDIYHYYKGVG